LKIRHRFEEVKKFFTRLSDIIWEGYNFMKSFGKLSSKGKKPF
jgi:hypothetical protein